MLQWQKVTPEKKSLSPLGVTVCRAAPQWHEMVMVLSAASILEIEEGINLQPKRRETSSSEKHLQTYTATNPDKTWTPEHLDATWVGKGGQVGGEILLAPHLKHAVGPW